jgi:hypothetical protein
MSTPLRTPLTFTMHIAAPRAVVWETMLERPTYEAWASAFMPGCTFIGSWTIGETMRFTDGSGFGMVATVTANRKHEYVEVVHVGTCAGDVEDRSAPWAPAREAYTFSEAAGGTEVRVELDSPTEWAADMRTMWPAALERLREVAEARSAEV